MYMRSNSEKATAKSRTPISKSRPPVGKQKNISINTSTASVSKLNPSSGRQRSPLSMDSESEVNTSALHNSIDASNYNSHQQAHRQKIPTPKYLLINLKTFHEKDKCNTNNPISTNNKQSRSTFPKRRSPPTQGSLDFSKSNNQSPMSIEEADEDMREDENSEMSNRGSCKYSMEFYSPFKAARISDRIKPKPEKKEAGESEEINKYKRHSKSKSLSINGFMKPSSSNGMIKNPVANKETDIMKKAHHLKEYIANVLQSLEMFSNKTDMVTREFSEIYESGFDDYTIPEFNESTIEEDDTCNYFSANPEDYEKLRQLQLAKRSHDEKLSEYASKVSSTDSTDVAPPHLGFKTKIQNPPRVIESGKSTTVNKSMSYYCSQSKSKSSSSLNGSDATINSKLVMQKSLDRSKSRSSSGTYSKAREDQYHRVVQQKDLQIKKHKDFIQNLKESLQGLLKERSKHHNEMIRTQEELYQLRMKLELKLE